MQVKVCSFGPGQNLQPLIELIRREHIEFSLTEDEVGTHLFVDDRDVVRVGDLLRGAIRPIAANPENLAWLTIKRSPLTFIFAMLGLLGFALTHFDLDFVVVRWLTFTEINVLGDQVQFAGAAQTYTADHQWWRLLTPAFLHFGVAHILFNGLALWEVGRRLEYCLKPRWYLFFFLFIAVAANAAQYWSFGSSIFGGLSGVLYGFFGMQPVLYYRTRHRLLAMPKGMYIILAISLLLGPLGIMEKVFGVNIADGAHFGGLFCGVIMAAIVPLSALTIVPEKH